MFVRLSFVVMLMCTFVGCSNSPASNPPTEKTTPVKNQMEKGSKKAPSGTEKEARAILKTVLDSWAFGDTLETFEKDHPGIQFFDTSRITKKTLGRYEIGSVRQKGGAFEILVTLTFKEEAGDVNRSGSYLVVKDAEGWMITGGAN